jgi:hypothetical protein
LALYNSPGTYRRPLKKYLNDFAARHRVLNDLPRDALRDSFEQSAKLLIDGPGPSALRTGSSQVNAALTEAIFIGLARRLDAGTAPEPEAVGGAITEMLEDEQFLVAISRATADEESVRTRLAVAAQAFSKV